MSGPGTELPASDAQFSKVHFEQERRLREVLLKVDAGRYREAVVDLKRILKIDPTFSDGIYWLGYCLEKQGYDQEAFHCYVELVRYEPSEKSLFQLAQMAYKVGEFQVAEKSGRECLKRINYESPYLFEI
ncbi:MAG: hypothetical protein KDD25_10385, partial [Bdellovibrionales bacterium]|nr:hypothetical protein [Bdellovibrionales bacterium]